MEVMAGADSAEEARACRAFLETFTVHPVSAAVAEEAVRLRATFRIRQPDAIVWATARSEGCLLVTRNARDFPRRNRACGSPTRFERARTGRSGCVRRAA